MYFSVFFIFHHLAFNNIPNQFNIDLLNRRVSWNRNWHFSGFSESHVTAATRGAAHSVAVRLKYFSQLFKPQIVI